MSCLDPNPVNMIYREKNHRFSTCGYPRPQKWCPDLHDQVRCICCSKHSTFAKEPPGISTLSAPGSQSRAFAWWRSRSLAVLETGSPLLFLGSLVPLRPVHEIWTYQATCPLDIPWWCLLAYNPIHQTSSNCSCVMLCHYHHPSESSRKATYIASNGAP